jgi:hypothetical protein
LGPDHLDTLISMNNLGKVYGDEGKYAQAEALYNQTSEIKRRVLGADRPNRSMPSRILLSCTSDRAIRAGRDVRRAGPGRPFARPGH